MPQTTFERISWLSGGALVSSRVQKPGGQTSNFGPQLSTDHGVPENLVGTRVLLPVTFSFLPFRYGKRLVCAW